MEIKSNVLTLTDVADQLKGSVSDVSELVRTGALPVFHLGNEVRTTQRAVNEMIENMISESMQKSVKTKKAILLNQGNLLQLPSLADIKKVNGLQVAPVKYKSRTGQVIEINDIAFEYKFNLNGKDIFITIVIFSSEGHFYKGKFYPNWGAEVNLGKIGHGMRAVNEWLRTSDYGTSKKLASVIKKGTLFAKEGDLIDSEYSQLIIDQYDHVITRKSTKKSQCVVCEESDHAAMLLHALVRCRSNGWI
jgi:hypothetical protein